MHAEAQLIFSFLFSLEYSPWDCVAILTFLETPSLDTSRGIFLHDSKSYQVDNQDQSPQFVHTSLILYIQATTD